MEQIFKVGDKVFDIRYGWGVVSSVNILTNDWPVEVVFDGEEELLDDYTFDGRAFINYPPTLSFTEYTLEGFSQDRPEELPNRGDVVWIKEMGTKMYVPIIFMEAINDDYVLSFNFINIKVINKDFVLTKNPYTNEQ